MTGQQLINQVAEQEQSVEALRQLWRSLFGSAALPTDQQFLIWLASYNNDIELIANSIKATWRKFQHVERAKLETDRLVRFTSSCANYRCSWKARAA